MSAPTTGELTYWVISTVGGRRTLDGTFQLLEAFDPEGPAGRYLPIFQQQAAAKAELTPRQIGAYFKHYVHIKNTGAVRVTQRVAIALAEPETFTPSASREQAFLAEQHERVPGKPVLDLRPVNDPQIPSSAPLAYEGDIDLHPGEDVHVTLTTVIRDPTSFQAISTGPPLAPTLYCRGIRVLPATLQTAAERKLAAAEAAAAKATRALRRAIAAAFLTGVILAKAPSSVGGVRWLLQDATVGEAVHVGVNVVALALLAVSGSMVAALLSAEPTKVLINRWRFRIWAAITLLAAAGSLI